jgi:ABC-2 type transport system ATP-binding protein
MNEDRIVVKDVSKSFKLPHEKHDSIKKVFVNIFRKRRGYEKQQVLNDVSFSVKSGEFFGIVGRNGSGKSTLLKLLAGIYSPDHGSLAVNGRLTPFIELGVGFNPELTGRENIFLNGALLGFNRKEVSKMYDEIVEFAELEKFMDQKLKNYSSGMQVRLAFSIAIRAESDILLIDEVLAVGDAAFQRKCFDYFMKIKKEKRTLVLVTHDMGAVRRYCDRAIMIDKGKVVERGSPEKVAQAYQRLFSTEAESHSAVANVNAKRWGNSKMVATKTKAEVTSETITLSVRYEAKQDIGPPILGFQISGPSGETIVEGNTLREKRKTESMSKGDIADITWQVPNIMGSGNYDVSVACCDQSTTEFYDWYNGAASFTINKENETSAVVDPKIHITYSKTGVK